MREITHHRANPANDKIQILVNDEPGAGGANHRYELTGFDTEKNPSALDPQGYHCGFRKQVLLFQNGPINEAGVNGITQEVLIAICIDRLACFQKGPFACEDNADALSLLLAAQNALHRRTRARLAKGIEGTHIVDALSLLLAAQNALHRRTRARLAKGIEGTHIVDAPIHLFKKSPLWDRLQALIVDQLGVNPSQVTPEASFLDDLGADSLGFVDLVFALEEEFKTEFADEEAEKVVTVEDALTLIESKLNRKS